MHGSLSRLPSWELDHKEEDIRGWLVRDADGHTMGTVKELIVDTETKHVTEVVLSDGKRWPAHDIELGDRSLTLLARTNGGASEPAFAASAPAAAAASSERAALLDEARLDEARLDEARLEREEGAPLSAGEDRVIPVIDEDFELSKRRMEAGGARVRRYVVEEPFEAELELREEKVTVERQKVDRLLSPEEAAERFRDESIEMTARTEHATKEKTAHVVEEVILGMEVDEHVEHVTETVRHTDVTVTEIPRAKLASAQGAKP